MMGMWSWGCSAGFSGSGVIWRRVARHRIAFSTRSLQLKPRLVVYLAQSIEQRRSARSATRCERRAGVESSSTVQFDDTDDRRGGVRAGRGLAGPAAGA
eukprot:scaffold5720_cov127-Isochrysis_galbana.AAC.1